jgi:PPM family protein phosphatase
MELQLDSHTVTDIGLARDTNQDRCGAFTPEDPQTRGERGRLFVVADGMGGHAGGDVAAELTIQSLPAAYFNGEWSGPPATLRSAFLTANAAIEQHAYAEPERRGMGAAAVALAVVDGRAVLGHLGDCRAYRVRESRVERLTADHSWVQERLDAGWLTAEEAQSHAYRHILTRALGAEADANPTLKELDFIPGDVLVLCSDGLWGVVEDEELAEVIAREEPAKDAARSLVDLALQRGGPDNIAVAVIRAVGVGEGHPREP